MIAFRCQACGACSQNVSPNCTCTDEDRIAAIDAEIKDRADAVSAAVLRLSPGTVAKYALRGPPPDLVAFRPIVTTNYRVVGVGGVE